MLQEIALGKLFASINELDRSVSKVQTTFESRSDIPADVHSRLLSYKEIVAKQRELWFELETVFTNENKERTAQLVIKINALSNLLLEDIRSAIASLDGKQAETKINSALN